VSPLLELAGLHRYWAIWPDTGHDVIDDVHRLVYAVDDADIDLIACRGHDDD